MNHKPPIRLIDTHCHLNHPDLMTDLPNVLVRARDAGVIYIICAGYDLQSSIDACRLAGDHRVVYAAVGVHPHDADTFTPDVMGRIEEMASDREHVVAIGETGLDYHYDHSPREIQREAYGIHIEMASRLDLPLVIHSRDAGDDVLAILREHGMPPRGAVMHCLPSDPDFARGAIEMGCYVGIAGPLTFRNAQALRDIVSRLPLDRLLLETDAPYLTPHPHRGQRNEPSYLPLVAEMLTEIFGVSVDTVANTTTSNANVLFGLANRTDAGAK